jgi:hypothetical protein
VLKELDLRGDLIKQGRNRIWTKGLGDLPHYRIKIALGHALTYEEPDEEPQGVARGG